MTALRRMFAAALSCVLFAAPAGAQTTTGPVHQTDASPSRPLDPQIVAMIANISPDHLRSDDERLVAFGTRNLFSETLNSRTRGVYAARDWIADQFRAAARHSDGRMSVTYDTYVQAKTERTPRAVEVSSVIATLRGDDPTRGTYVMSSHYDSRNSDGNNATLDAPGADDNGSGTIAVLAAARAMAATRFRGTIVFACFDGEEQGLFGSDHYAKVIEASGTQVAADINNDIIGASVGHDGETAPDDVRLFSEGLPPGATPRLVNLLGTENDSPSRELARFAKETGEAYVPAMHVELIYRSDRFLRGGDQQSFAAQGFAAIRFVEAHENFDHQHQTIRVENGVQYGDLLQYVDFSYVARVAQLNVAALATLALAPAKPAALLTAKELAYTSTLVWNRVPGATSYELVWRRTNEPMWTHAKDVGDVTTATLPLSKDDWLFGVRSLDAAGNRSPAAFPTPVR